MFRKLLNSSYLLILLVIVTSGAAWAQSGQSGYDMIAQADSEHPVYGWYPTTKWNVGEIVREDYELTVPPGKILKLLSIGMYTRDAAGAFHNLGMVNIPLRSP